MRRDSRMSDEEKESRRAATLLQMERVVRPIKTTTRLLEARRFQAIFSVGLGTSPTAAAAASSGRRHVLGLRYGRLSLVGFVGFLTTVLEIRLIPAGALQLEAGG